ncbi:MAG: pentapeptide repeat-containing protein [Cyanobacteria bacterium CRU_2_1]|nr:pentapeptide repeat-containing protein [Cyanobacteria bacterium CRU_2_1]
MSLTKLGCTQVSVRIGGIYALARIAHDSAKDHWMIMEVLTAFVRDRRGLAGAGFSTQPKKFDKDVQSAVSVIGRRNVSQDPDDTVLYLNYNDLRGVVFSDTDYSYTQFHGSDLREVNFNRCKLQSTRFWKSNLAESRFRDADLSDADLVEADLRGADLQNCSLRGADLRKANLEGVKGLTVDQVQSANNWKEAIYDTNFLILLGSDEKNTDK